MPPRRCTVTNDEVESSTVINGCKITAAAVSCLPRDPKVTKWRKDDGTFAMPLHELCHILAIAQTQSSWPSHRDGHGAAEIANHCLEEESFPASLAYIGSKVGLFQARPV